METKFRYPYEVKVQFDEWSAGHDNFLDYCVSDWSMNCDHQMVTVWFDNRDEALRFKFIL